MLRRNATIRRERYPHLPSMENSSRIFENHRHMREMQHNLKTQNNKSTMQHNLKTQNSKSTSVPPPFWWVLPSALHSEGKVVVANSSTGLQPHLTLDSTIGLRHTFSEKRSGMNTHDMHRTNTHDSEIIMHRTNTHDRKRAYETTKCLRNE